MKLVSDDPRYDEWDRRADAAALLYAQYYEEQVRKGLRRPRGELWQDWLVSMLLIVTVVVFIKIMQTH